MIILRQAPTGNGPRGDSYLGREEFKNQQLPTPADSSGSSASGDPTPIPPPSSYIPSARPIHIVLG
jgi:hypothetical protein